LGAELYRQGDYRHAAECFRRMAELLPDQGLPRVWRGLCEYRLGDYERALLHLQAGRVRGIEGPEGLRNEARLAAGLLLNRFGEFQAAFETLESFAKDSSPSREVLAGLGLSALQYPYLPSEVPEDQRAAVQLAGEATWAAVTHEFSRADQLFQRLLEQYPRQPGVNYACGVYLARDRKELAMERFREELRLNPWHVPSLLQLAFEYIERGETSEALKHARQALEVEPASHKALYALGWALLEQGDTAAAIEALEDAVAVEPSVPELRFNLSRAYQRAGRVEEAARERAIFRELSALKQTIRERVKQ
jgi:tetratricopeptide (TPR) repeat protein